jgi:phospholipid/cholesterol/gamma-HCH transport system substrate-binding protein
MITRRTKVQLMIFVLITLLGVSFVGARYAKLDRYFVDKSYTVVAHFPDSGGIFATGLVTYRGVSVGRVSKLVLTKEGVDLQLSIDRNFDQIPADAIAVVANRSAVGEQYVDLQPQSDKGPFLQEDSEIDQENTRIPISTETLLGDLSTTVESVDKEALHTTVTEMGDAFAGTGEDLQRIIDTGNSFIQEANANFDVTTALIHDSNIALHGQIASASAIRNFSRQLALFSTTLADADPDLRRLIDTGSVAAVELRQFLEANRVELGDLINNLVTTGQIVVKHLDGIKQVLVLYPYTVEGGFTVASKSPDTGLYDAHFGMIITNQKVCKQGYNAPQRKPSDGSNAPMDENARCTEPPTVSNARGAQNAPRRAGTLYNSPVVASYDPETGKLRWGGDIDPELAPTGTVAPQTLGEESWKWLFLQPLTAAQE